MPQRPTPKRRRLHIVRLATLVALLISITLWLTWLAVAQARLNSALSRARATGNPLNGSRLPWRPPPTTLPTANFLHQAIATASPYPVPPNTYIPNALPILPRVQAPPTPDPVSQSWLRNNPRALYLARQARDTEETPWTPADSVGPLADLLTLASAQAHESGNDREAIALALDLLHLARSLQREPTEILFTRGENFEKIACTDLQTAVAAPTISTVLSSLTPDRKSIEALIPALLDESDLRRHFESRVQDSLSDDYRTLTRNISSAILLRPMAQLNAASVIEERTATLEALHNTAYPTASYRLQPVDSSPLCGNGRPILVDNDCGTLFCWYFDVSSLTVEQLFNTIARRRLLATDLAIQLYRADHHHWPAALKDLVPRYLPTIPDDPFGAPGKPPEYVILTQDNVQRPLLGCRYISGLFTALPPSPSPYYYSADFYSSSYLDSRWIDLSSPAHEPSNPAASQPAFNP